MNRRKPPRKPAGPPILDDDEAEIVWAALEDPDKAGKAAGMTAATRGFVGSMLGWWQRYVYMGRGIWISRRVFEQGDHGRRATELLREAEAWPVDQSYMVFRHPGAVKGKESR